MLGSLSGGHGRLCPLRPRVGGCAIPPCAKIRLVQDNLNTHDGASLYETFGPEEARRILDKIEFHYTPKHGSWLNMAETEISIMGRQCLDRRMDSQGMIAGEVAAWEKGETRGRHASTGRSPWPLLDGNSGNFTHQSKIDGPLGQVSARKPLLAASLVSFERKCGKPGCHCAAGEKHRGHQLTYNDRGKTRTVYVPVDFTDEVRSWIDEHRRLKALLQEISQLSLDLVRSHARERKRRKGRL